MTVTYCPLVGANMISTITNAAGTAVAKTNASGGNGRNGRTLLAMRLDALDATSTANDRTVNILVNAPPGIDVSGGLGANFEDDYTPMFTITPGNAATALLMDTVKPFLQVQAVTAATRLMNLRFTVITGGDGLIFFISANWGYSAV